MQLKTSSRRFTARGGISTASPFAQIRRGYPKLARTLYLKDEETGKGLDYYDDSARGIAFAFVAPTSKKRDQETPWIIVVHRRGHQAIPTEIPDLRNKGLSQ